MPHHRGGRQNLVTGDGAVSPPQKHLKLILHGAGLIDAGWGRVRFRNGSKGFAGLIFLPEVMDCFPNSAFPTHSLPPNRRRILPARSWALTSCSPRRTQACSLTPGNLKPGLDRSAHGPCQIFLKQSPPDEDDPGSSIHPPPRTGTETESNTSPPALLCSAKARTRAEHGP